MEILQTSHIGGRCPLVPGPSESGNVLAEVHIWCVTARAKGTPPSHSSSPSQQHSHISSSALQRHGAPAQVGCSGSICCYYFPPIIGLNNGMSVSLTPLKLYTLFIFQLDLCPSLFLCIYPLKIWTLLLFFSSLYLIFVKWRLLDCLV